MLQAFFFEPDPDDHHHDHHDEHHENSHGGHEPKDGFWANINEAPILCVAPLCLTALGCIALFFLAPHIYNLVITITEV